MDLKDYIGKELRELVADTPDYALGFHVIVAKGNVFSMLDISKHEECLDNIIRKVSEQNTDYTYWIYLNN